MNQLSYESQTVITRTKQPPKSRTIPRWVSLMAILFVWLLVAIGGFALARYYIEDIQQQLDQISATNQEEIQLLTARLASLQTQLDEHQTQAEALQQQFAIVEKEIAAVKEEMSLAGDSLHSTAETKQALSERMSDLGAELAELRKLIKKLEEAARVY